MVDKRLTISVEMVVDTAAADTDKNAAVEIAFDTAAADTV